MRAAYDNHHEGIPGCLSRPRTASTDHRPQTGGMPERGVPPKDSPPSRRVQRRPIVHNGTDRRSESDNQRYFEDRQSQDGPRSSIESVASTTWDEDDSEDVTFDHQMPKPTFRRLQSDAVAATPAQFSGLFPSSRRLLISHDDATTDGNMNLRVGVRALVDGQIRDITLYHLRMHDLKTREFSLRRYHRDSGREVCHSSRKVAKSASNKRPSIKPSLSNALSSMRPKSEHRKSNGSSVGPLTRHDSGYDSGHSVDPEDYRQSHTTSQLAASQDQLSENKIHLEFSTYAQIDVRRSGTGKRHHQFEYWGVHYSWKRRTYTAAGRKHTAFELTKAGDSRILARIKPIDLTEDQAEAEQHKGGWVAPCSLWMPNESPVVGQKDLADVVVATGLITLADDAIRARYRARTKRPFVIPVPRLHVDIEYVSPQRMLGSMFNARDVTSEAQRPTSKASSTSSYAPTKQPIRILRRHATS